MAARFAFQTFVRNFRIAQWQHNGNRFLNQSTVFGLNQCQGLRALHRLVYDKESEWYTQRKQVLEQALEQEALTSKTAAKSGLDAVIEESIIAQGISSDPDAFGDTNSEELKFDEQEFEDEGDAREEDRQQRWLNRKPLDTQYQYAFKLKELLNRKRLLDAIEFVEQKMLKEDFVKPNMYIYRLIINACARYGNTKKAFEFYHKMRSQQLQPNGKIYTALFNACANAPTQYECMSRARGLRELMYRNQHDANDMTYHAMIKAFGRGGDLRTAFLLVDEMVERKLHVSTETFNFLFQACASDKESGFRHCLLTWHKMWRRGLRPDKHTFRSILRCIRDSGMGDLETTHKLLAEIAPQRDDIDKLHATSEKAALPHQQIESDLPVVRDNKLQLTSQATELQAPNLMLPVPHLGSMIALSQVNHAHDRLQLVGGVEGFMQHMKNAKVAPGIEILTLLLESAPPTNAADKLLLSYVHKIGLKADIDFFNIMMKRRCLRYDYEGAREIMTILSSVKVKLMPDIVTYGVLAMACPSLQDARELLFKIQTDGVTLNMQILGALLKSACLHGNVRYIVEVMQVSIDENIAPNEQFLKHLDNIYKKRLDALDKGLEYTKTEKFMKAHMYFCDKYRAYYAAHGLRGFTLEEAIKKVTKRPYQLMAQKHDEGGEEPTKDKGYIRKQKKRFHIRRIKPSLLKDDAPVVQKKNTQTEKIAKEKEESTS